MKAALLDIEGTIGDIAFVRDVLFPFARARIPDTLKARWADPEVEATVVGAREASGNFGLSRVGSEVNRYELSVEVPPIFSQFCCKILRNAPIATEKCAFVTLRGEYALRAQHDTEVAR